MTVGVSNVAMMGIGVGFGVVTAGGLAGLDATFGSTAGTG